MSTATGFVHNSIVCERIADGGSHLRFRELVVYDRFQVLLCLVFSLVWRGQLRESWWVVFSSFLFPRRVVCVCVRDLLSL